MTKRSVKSHGYANRTPWSEATREVPSAWLGRRSKALLFPLFSAGLVEGQPRWSAVACDDEAAAPATQRRPAGPSQAGTAGGPPAARQDMLQEIWERAEEAGEKDPVWRLVEGVLRLALDRVRTVRVEPDHPKQIWAHRAP